MGITKGALYHYFPSKLDLGYAIVDEIIAPAYTGTWRILETIRKGHLEMLLQLVENFKKRTDSEEIKLGCPLNNLMQEMSPLDEGFRIRLEKIVTGMVRSIETGLRNGQEAGTIQSGADPRQLAFFILSCIEGSYGIAKSAQSKEVFDASINQLMIFLKMLKIK